MLAKNGGGRGIRTPVRVTPQTVFKTAGFNHSPIPPLTKLPCTPANRPIPRHFPNGVLPRFRKRQSSRFSPPKAPILQSRFRRCLCPSAPGAVYFVGTALRSDQFCTALPASSRNVSTTSRCAAVPPSRTCANQFHNSADSTTPRFERYIANAVAILALCDGRSRWGLPTPNSEICIFVGRPTTSEIAPAGVSAAPCPSKATT